MITIVVGGQYGGEGKGKICSYLGLVNEYKYVCRTGGVNSSHAVKNGNSFYKLRMVPASAVVGDSVYLYGAGSLIHIETLKREMALLGVKESSVIIDPRAGVVSDEIVAAQRRDSRYAMIGSTLTGTGYATAERSLRRLKLASDYPELTRHLGDVALLLSQSQADGLPVLMEGHQGAGLSNYHGDYPFTSSRDCGAAAILSEVGLGPRMDLDIVLTIKMFPTRNHEGRLPNELSESTAKHIGVIESGGGSWGVPDRTRRVAQIHWEDIERAILLNSPTSIALTGFDYAFPSARRATSVSMLPPQAERFLAEMERRTGLPVELVSTGPDVRDTIARSARFQVGLAGKMRHRQNH